ncbi:MAG: hypothetical protein LBG10_07925, partial [Treponema sp.]|nr:hypothetical protein [Treponema sp.]
LCSGVLHAELARTDVYLGTAASGLIGRRRYKPFPGVKGNDSVYLRNLFLSTIPRLFRNRGF